MNTLPCECVTGKVREERASAIANSLLRHVRFTHASLDLNNQKPSQTATLSMWTLVAQEMPLSGAAMKKPMALFKIFIPANL